MKQLYVTILATVATAVAINLPARAESPSETAGAQSLKMVAAPFGVGEELIYNVSYRAALIPPINMMRISIRTLGEQVDGISHFHIVGNGKTTGAAKGVLDLNDTYHSWLDSATLLPSRTSSNIRENDYRFTAAYDYDWRAMRVSNVRRNHRWDEPRRATFTLPSHDCGDALSLFYRLRAVDATSLVAGVGNRLDLVLDEDTKPIYLRFVGRETVKVRRLGTFRALKFTCTMATSDGSTYEDGMTLTAWVSDDANHIPLMVESPIRVGRVSVTLANNSTILHPMTSRVE